MENVTAERARLDPDIRRAQLVGLGVQMLASRSLDQVPVDEIAAAAGISRGLLFHYFPSKRDFHVAVAQAAADDFLAETEGDPSLPIGEQLHDGLDRYVRYVEEHQPGYMAHVRGAAGGDELMARVFEQTRSRIVERMLAALDHQDPPAILALAVRGWVAMCEETTVEWLRQPRVTREAVIELLEQALVELLALALAPHR